MTCSAAPCLLYALYAVSAFALEAPRASNAASYSADLAAGAIVALSYFGGPNVSDARLVRVRVQPEGSTQVFACLVLSSGPNQVWAVLPAEAHIRGGISNRVTISKASAPGACVHPLGLSTGELTTLDQGGSIPFGSVSVSGGITASLDPSFRGYYRGDSIFGNFLAARAADIAQLAQPLNSGISAQLNQTANPRQAAVPVYAVQQPKCLDPFSPCTPVTTVTVRIPFELLAPADEYNLASLKILDQGKPSGEFALRPVADNIHFGNLCDQTAIAVGAPVEATAGCIPLLQHTNGQLVSPAKPAHWGEVLLGWAYGLGAVNSSASSGPTPTAQTFALGFTLQPNAAANRPLARLGATAPAWTGIADATGMYHVNFVLPAIAPPGQFLPCDGVEVRSNLTITLAGVKSMDGAAICVAP